MINSVEYENIKLGNYSELAEILETDFNIKCDSIIINDKNKNKAIWSDENFFGILVMPKFTQNIVRAVYNSAYSDNGIPEDEKTNDEILVKSFDLEIDSRTFEMLDYKEFFTYLEYEINKYENISLILEKYYDFITVFCSHHGIKIHKTGKTELQILYYMMIRDYIVNTISIPRTPDIRILKDYVALPNLDNAIDIAKKIYLNAGTITNYCTSPEFLTVFILLALNDIDAMKFDTIAYLSLLKNRSTSKLYQKIYESCIDCLDNLTSHNINVVTESLNIRNTKLYLDFKQSGAKRVEEKLYELTVQANTIQDKEDALSILREINSCIRILESMTSVPGLTKMNLIKYENLIEKFRDLRDQVVANKKLSKEVNILTLSDIIRGNYTI